MKTTPAQRRYLRGQFYGLTLGATVQRARVYKAGTTVADRTVFQVSLQHSLEKLARSYKVRQTEAAHVANIGRLAGTLSTKCSKCLRGGRFRIGPAQKALNLYLKYLWCAGEIPSPPHCPFDYLVIQQLELRNKLNWTNLDDLQAYRHLVAVARRVAQKVPLAEWELGLYNDLSPAESRAS